LVGLYGTSCEASDLEPATIRVLGIVSVDCYAESTDRLRQDLEFTHNRYGVPILLGEWGEIWDDGRQPATVNSIRDTFSMLSTLPFLVGVDYWQAYGGTLGENVIDISTLSLSLSGKEIQHWYVLWSSAVMSSHAEMLRQRLT